MEKVTTVHLAKEEQKVGTYFICQGLGREHRMMLESIRKNFNHFTDLGPMEKRTLTSTGGRAAKEFLLNYEQLLLLVSLMRNNDSSVEMKKTLIKTAEISKTLELIRKFDNDGIECRYVYAAMDEHGRVKIGISNNPKERVKQLNIGNADRLTLVFTKHTVGNGFSDEVILHEKCREFHVRGEWFKKEAIEELK